MSELDYRQAWDSLARQLHENAEVIVTESLESIDTLVERKWSGSVSGKLPRTHKVTKEGDTITGELVVGSRARFLAVIFEYGTRYLPAKPALIPAVEAEKEKLKRRAMKLGDGLRGV